MPPDTEQGIIELIRLPPGSNSSGPTSSIQSTKVQWLLPPNATLLMNNSLDIDRAEAAYSETDVVPAVLGAARCARAARKHVTPQVEPG